MKFLKVFLQIEKTKLGTKDIELFRVSPRRREGYDIYFTDEKGFDFIHENEGKFFPLKDLPTPLLKQIK